MTEIAGKKLKLPKKKLKLVQRSQKEDFKNDFKDVKTAPFLTGRLWETDC